MVSPLDRKLLRDLWRMKLQSFAIALVIAVGVLLLVMMDGLVNSLAQTRDAYYDRYRLAEVFAPVKRAPDHLLDRIAAIPGVSAVEGRVVGGALVDVEGHSLDALWRLATCREHAAKLWPLRIEHARHRARQVGPVEGQIAQRDGNEADAVADEGG